MADVPETPGGKQSEYVRRLGIRPGETVQEVGWDEDCDSSISEAIEDFLGESLLEEETDEICDTVLLWWRASDGDLVDGLVDAVRPLDEGGRVWLLTPSANNSDTITPGDIAESAQLAGLVQTSAERLGNWQGSCLVPGGAGKR